MYIVIIVHNRVLYWWVCDIVLGLVEGYSSEKKQTEESLRSLEDGKEALIVELERTRARLSELEEAQTELEQRENNLVRQREVLEQSMGQEEQGRADVFSIVMCQYRVDKVSQKLI